MSFGVIRCTCLEVACNSRMVGGRAKQFEIWDRGVLISHAMGSFRVNRYTCLKTRLNFNTVVNGKIRKSIFLEISSHRREWSEN